MIPFPDKKYNIIYADPPWNYKLWNKRELKGHQLLKDRNAGNYRRMASSLYSIMTNEELKQLPIQDIADKNCALICWVTNPLLPDGLEVIKSWGFEFKTVLFCWVKTTVNGKVWFGMGNYTRSSMELCLLAMKGSLPRLDRSIKQVQLSQFEGHSKKPHLFRELILQLFGDLPRIELFSRHKIEGWDSWGNEV